MPVAGGGAPDHQIVSAVPVEVGQQGDVAQRLAAPLLEPCRAVGVPGRGRQPIPRAVARAPDDEITNTITVEIASQGDIPEALVAPLNAAGAQRVRDAAGRDPAPRAALLVPHDNVGAAVAVEVRRRW